ncbi:hypothetical protein GQ53DRAFT_33065 [Thozetella sp. PMI_491]|nr:hypothetical protein GQ53DRAFT_33065 [Thozetella sp. PMI_491]
MGGGPFTPEEIRSLLTPELLAMLVRARLPYDKFESIDFARFGREIFLVDHFGPVVERKVWPVLIALSKIGLERMPDLSRYLPPPTDPTFPEQCLGLLLLVDHCPRLLFKGVDHRYTYAYFSEISQRLATYWHELPPAQRPDSWERWQHEAGLDYWIGVRFWFGTPFVHSEHDFHQEIALGFTEETRSVVESVSGIRDPYRTRREAILSDIYGFPREYRAGPPQGRDVTRESWMFWMGMLMDIHKPIIDRYGRYPYLNAICGRSSTVGEKNWIEKTTHYGEASEEVAKKIAADVRRGRWRPLGEDSLDW